MSKYNMKCPCCGTENRDLYLEETDGWMECEKCGKAVHISMAAGETARKIFPAIYQNTRALQMPVTA